MPYLPHAVSAVPALLPEQKRKAAIYHQRREEGENGMQTWSSLYKDNLYVTSTGECYHKKECIFIKNKTNTRKLAKEEFEKGTYSPCDMCLPNNN